MKHSGHYSLLINNTVNKMASIDNIDSLIVSKKGLFEDNNTNKQNQITIVY